MKKYFTKYLPVEGEIKEGDWYCDGNLLNKKLEPEEWRVGKNWKKAKLFLCSRDIQVGDTVQSEFGTDKIAVERNGIIGWNNPNIIGVHFYFSPDDFKIIGEISPEATWVTEGMEFDEDQIEHGGWRDEELTQIICKIKCPTCNKFH